MATLQGVWDQAEIINRELRLQSGEADVTHGLAASNMAKDHFEAIVAQYPGVLGSDIGTVTTSASTESTAFPSGVIRIDGLWFIDPSTSRPAWRLDELYEAGGHANVQHPPVLASSSNVTGRPRGYWTDGSNVYWEPLPDGTHTVRYYGFAVASDFTAAADTFPYPDICRPAFANFIARAFKIGVEDQTKELTLLGQQIFGEVIEAMTRFRREAARPARYRYASVV